MQVLQDASSAEVWENRQLVCIQLQFITTTPVQLAIIFRVFKTAAPTYRATLLATS